MIEDLSRDFLIPSIDDSSFSEVQSSTKYNHPQKKK